MREMIKDYPNSGLEGMLDASAPRAMQRTSTPVCPSRFRQCARRTSLPKLLAMLLGSALAVALGSSRSLCAQRTSGGILRGATTAANPQGQALIIGGVQLKLRGTAPGSTPLSTFSDDTGAYEFPDLPPGAYTLEASLEGFKTVLKKVTIPAGQTVVENIELELEEVRQQVEVRGTALTVSQQSSSPPATLTSPQFMAMPIPPQRFTNALPLVPGVIRTPDDKLNFKGETENQGMLLVDGTQTIDPITGSFAINIPIDAIQTMNVYKAPADAEYGGFSGGLTSLQTKPPEDHWNYSLHDFLPGLRGRSGHLVGIQDDIPRLVFGGSLIKGKLSFSENFQYEVNKKPIRGLAWPHNETKTQGVDSFTIFQAILSPRHVLTAEVNVFPLRKQFSNINALLPQSASSDFGQHGFSIAGNDSYQFTSGALLTTLFQFTDYDSNAHGQGPADTLLTPEATGGNFFNTWRREGNQEQASSVFQFPGKQWYGRHDFKIGAEFARRSYTGTSHSRPVRLLREDGTLAEEIDFSGGGFLSGEDTEVSEFAQDHWSFGQRIALDLGLRLVTQSVGRSAAVAPRAGLVYSLDSDAKTILRTGGGLFYDRVPLLGTDFTENPTRILSFFDSQGVPTGAPVVLANVYLRRQSGQPQAPGFTDLGTSPRNFSWNFEVDRQLSSRLVLRAGYLYSRTRDEFVVGPRPGALPGESFLALTPTGGTHYHEFETTLKFHPNERDQVSVSYVNSHARGNLNTLTSIFVPFEAPVIRPDAVAKLNSDIPNRLVAWGIFHLPWEFGFSPVFDVHTGYPYSNVDVLQNYVGRPNTQRFPTLLSFDWKVWREFRLQVPLVHKSFGKFRLGIYYTNFTGHSNPLQVFNNVTSPNFGQFLGFQHRISGFVFETAN